MLKAVFYARFHAVRGPSVIHQHPPQSIIPSTESGHPLVTWSNITSYIIPPYDLCNQPLSICTEGCRILAFPVSIEDGRYDRNRFTFNICFVLSEQEDMRQWESLVRKTAAFFQTMEAEDNLLSAEETLQGLKWAGEPDYPAANVGIVYPLLATIAEDLNAYGECSARVNDLHVLNLRLVDPSPALQTPKIHAWDVPLLIRDLPDSQAWTWDLTLRRIHPHIDGVRHVARIAELADVERRLVRRAVAELVHHRRATLLDLFHFQAVYAGTAALARFVHDTGIQDECRMYISLNPFPDSSDDTPAATTAATAASGAATATADDDDDDDDDATPSTPSRATVVTLYAGLQPGTPLAAFCHAHAAELAGIDVRRFVTFGILKGLLRRVHKFALATEPPPPAMPTTGGGNGGGSGGGGGGGTGASAAVAATGPLSIADGRTTGGAPKSFPDDDGAAAAAAAAVRDFDRAWKRAALSSGWATPPSNPPPLPPSFGRGGSHKSADQVRSEEDEKLRRYLDGRHCLDWICVEMHLSEQRVLERLRSGRFGEVVLISK